MQNNNPTSVKAWHTSHYLLITIISLTSLLNNEVIATSSTQRPTPIHELEATSANALPMSTNDWGETLTSPAAQLRLGETDSQPDWQIDTTQRPLVQAFYKSVYNGSNHTTPTWTGSIADCEAGTTDPAFRQAILARINYFRAMAGVPATIRLDENLSTKAQQAALMMSANHNLSHYPSSSWDCYSAEGAEAAGNSNLSWGTYGPEAISSYMDDYGSNNAQVGHRAWLLKPQQSTMGTGDVPASSYYRAANAIWVTASSDNTTATLRDPYIAWPPQGYMPYSITPNRWSLEKPGADFTNAQITVSQAGVEQNITVESYSNGRLVWHLADRDPNQSSAWPRPTQDTAYDVSVSNISTANGTEDYQYRVTIFDPLQDTADTLAAEVDGSNQPSAGISSYYTLGGVADALHYQARLAEITASSGAYNAEDNSLAIIDHSSDSYTLRNIGGYNNPSYIYKLSPESRFESFQLADTYIPSGSSELSFKSRLGYATTEQVATVQVSRDGGVNWQTVYEQAGESDDENAPPVDENFVEHRVSLADYAGRFITVRFNYAYSGVHYVGHEKNVSFLVDDITISNSERLVNETLLSPNSNHQISFIPALDKQYALAARATLWEGYPALEWGAAMKISPSAAPALEDLQLNVRAFLQGAFDPTQQMMRDNLRAAALIPSQQPYNSTPFNYNGTETANPDLLTETGANAPVDWVLVELRHANDPSIIVAQQAALLQRDGDIMQADTGADTLILPNLPADSYYLAIRHRNHLGIMTAQAISLSTTPATVDFTQSSTATYGENARSLNNDVALMWAGDINGDQRLIAAGPDNDSSLILSQILNAADNTSYASNYRLNGYAATDLNLDGSILYAGAGNDVNLLAINILLHPNNPDFTFNYIISATFPD